MTFKKGDLVRVDHFGYFLMPKDSPLYYVIDPVYSKIISVVLLEKFYQFPEYFHCLPKNLTMVSSILREEE